VADDLDDAIRALYAGDPAEFVQGRTALAKAHKDQAAEIKALRKPDKRAWALDRAAADDPEALQQLVAAAEAVAQAQETGGDLRSATSGLRDAVKALAARTPDHGTATADLVAVVADPDALDALVAGRLVSVPEAGGFGPLPTGPPAKDADAARRRQDEEERKAAAAARKAAEQDVAAAEAALADAVRARDEAQATVDAAEERLAGARAALDDLAR
jgi:hypothetical protein